MKISLKTVEGISILEAVGEFDSKNFKILSAGIFKLMRDGKNKIVLDINDTKEIEKEVIRELASIDIRARELSGRIVIVVKKESLRNEIVSFAKPPIIPVYSKIEEAIGHFKGSTANEETTLSEKDRILAEKDSMIAALEAKLNALNPKEIVLLKGEISELKDQNKKLIQQLEALLLKGREPISDAALLEKVSTLESAIKEFEKGASK
ncbi:MAG: hypothetical protein M9962_10180 [Oligoflexia bacterium]|nr:hypothetical protein [Oligoflexia bacterium]